MTFQDKEGGESDITLLAGWPLQARIITSHKRSIDDTISNELHDDQSFGNIPFLVLHIKAPSYNNAYAIVKGAKPISAIRRVLSLNFTLVLSS